MDRVEAFQLIINDSLANKIISRRANSVSVIPADVLAPRVRVRRVRVSKIFTAQYIWVHNCTQRQKWKQSFSSMPYLPNVVKTRGFLA